MLCLVFGWWTIGCDLLLNYNETACFLLSLHCAFFEKLGESDVGHILEQGEGSRCDDKFCLEKLEARR